VRKPRKGHELNKSARNQELRGRSRGYATHEKGKREQSNLDEGSWAIPEHKELRAFSKLSERDRTEGNQRGNLINEKHAPLGCEKEEGT